MRKPAWRTGCFAQSTIKRAESLSNSNLLGFAQALLAKNQDPEALQFVFNQSEGCLIQGSLKVYT